MANQDSAATASAYTEYEKALHAAALTFNASRAAINTSRLPPDDDVVKELETFAYCRGRIVPMTAAPSSLIVGSLAWAVIASFGRRTPSSAAAQRLFALRLPIAGAVAGTHLLYNWYNTNSAYYNVCYLCALGSRVEMGVRMRDAFRGVYPDSSLLAEAERLAASGGGVPSGSPQGDLTTRIMVLGPLIPVPAYSNAPPTPASKEKEAPRSLAHYAGGGGGEGAKRAPARLPSPLSTSASSADGDDVGSFSFSAREALDAEDATTDSATGFAPSLAASPAAEDAPLPSSGAPLSAEQRHRARAAARAATLREDAATDAARGGSGREADADAGGGFNDRWEGARSPPRSAALLSGQVAVGPRGGGGGGGGSSATEGLTSYEQRRRRRAELFSHEATVAPAPSGSGAGAGGVGDSRQRSPRDRETRRTMRDEEGKTSSASRQAGPREGGPSRERSGGGGGGGRGSIDDEGTFVVPEYDNDPKARPIEVTYTDEL